MRLAVILSHADGAKTQKMNSLAPVQILSAFGRALASPSADACAWAAGKRERSFPTAGKPWAGIMRQTNLTIPSQSASALQTLAELFPNVTPVRIPIMVSLGRGNGHLLEESTVIEYGTSTMVFFESRLPLELADKLHLENSDRSLGTDAVVVAIRDSGAHRAIAARFAAQVRNWILQG